MGHSKQNKGQKKDGQHRGETREERKERLRKQEEARQACFKLLPYVGGGVALFLIIFAAYVKSVPPKAPKPKASPMDAQRILQEAMEKGDIQMPPVDEMGGSVPAEGGIGSEGAAEAPTVTEDETPPAPGEEGESATEPDEERVEL